MKNNKQPVLSKIIFLIILQLLFFNCSTGAGKAGRGADQDNNDYKDDQKKPPVKTVRWKKDPSNYIQFFTNDSIYNSKKGRTFWYPFQLDCGPSQFIVNTVKVSGKSAFGYGIIFCIQDNPVNSLFVAKNFYAVMINTNGYFQIVKVVNGIQHILKITNAINGWVSPVNQKGDLLLYTGKNVQNTIKIIGSDTDQDDNPEFEIFFNDQSAYVFEESFINDNGQKLPLFSFNQGKDKYGFILTMSPREDFPHIPLDVRFKLIFPDVILKRSLTPASRDHSLDRRDLFMQNSGFTRQ